MVKAADKAVDPADVSAALLQLADWLEDAAGDAGWLAALRFGVAGALAQTSHAARAENLFHGIVAETPQHAWAWIGLIDLARARGDAPGAVALGRAAMAAIPDASVLRRKTAEALEQAEGPEAAIACLDPFGQPLQDADDLAYAIGLFRSAQRVAEAMDLFAALLAMRPDDPLALLARIEAGLAKGDDEAAHERAMMAHAKHPAHDEIRLRAAQASWRVGQGAGAAALLTPIPGDPTLAEGYVALALRLVATEGLDIAVDALLDALDDMRGALQHDDDPAPIFAMLATDPPLPWYRALALVARAHSAGRVALADSIAAALAPSGWSAADRLAFAVEYCLLRDGPLAASELLRRTGTTRRDAEAAGRLARVLLQAGQAGVAVRYLRFCVRRWPNDDALMDLACTAQIAAGQPDQVATLLARAAHPLAPGRVVHHRLSAALSMGDDHMAREICDGAVVADMPDAPLALMMTTYALQGDLGAAEACHSRITGEEGPLEAALIQRPRATRPGTLLNEARILAMRQAAGPANKQRGDRDSRDFFLAARPMLTVPDGPPAPGLPPSGDARAAGPVHLLWAAPDPATAEGQALVAAWTKYSGRSVNSLSLAQGAGWLERHVGAVAARAYRLTRDPRQQADLLLYAHLRLFGGVGLGAPHWPCGKIGAWIDTCSPVRFFRDEMGAPDTAMIVVPADDPVIVTAFEMAVAACLAHENEHRWFKTGPGLLARALAIHRETHAHTLSTQPELHRHVHPYGGMQT